MSAGLVLPPASQAPVLFCVGAYCRGGVSSWAIRFMRAARRAGAGVRLVVPWPVDERARDGTSRTVLEQAPDLDDPDVSIRLPVSVRERFSTRRERQRALARALATHAAGGTIILNNDWDMFGAVARLARDGVPMRVVDVVHSDDPLSYSIPRYYEPLFAGTVAVSSTIAGKLIAQGLVSASGPAPLAVIPCGVDMPPVSAREPGQGVLKLVTACRLEDRQKRIMDIPPVAAALRDAGVPFEWTILGGGPDRATLELALETHEVSDRVRLLGWRPHEEVLDAFRHSDVYVQTSAIEGTPVSVMESMACGAVPVVSEVSGTRELLGSNPSEPAGIAVTCGDVAGFRAAIERLHRQPGHRTTLARRAERRARTVLSTDRTAAETLDFVRGLPDIAAEWPVDRAPAIPLERVGAREARLDWLPNPVVVAARRVLRA